MKVLFLYPNLQLMQVVPPGLLTLSAYLKQHGVEVDIFDTTFYKLTPKSSDEERIESCQVRPFNFADAGVVYKDTDIQQDFYKKIDEFKPTILAITSNDFTHRIAERLIKNIKIKYPNLFIVTGGVFSTFHPNYAISVPEVDAICIGEGYGPLLDLCQKLFNRSILNIKNLWIKTPTDIIKNALREPLSLDVLPVDDYELFDKKRYFRPMQGKMLKMVPIWLDIGCPYQCQYCIAPGLRGLYKDKGFNYCRVKSVNAIMNDLQHARKTIDPNYIYFSTETFFARPKAHIEELAKRYKAEVGIPFWCESRVETLTDFNCSILKEMGCDRISVGLEAGNEDYRINVLHKTFTNQQFLDGINMLNKYGIKATVNTIIGLPDETRQLIFDSIELNRKMLEGKDIDITITVSSYVPCGGTELSKYCISKGYYDSAQYLLMENTSFHKGAFLTQPSITQKEVKGLLRTFPLYVRMDKSQWSAIETAESDSLDGNEIYTNLKKAYWLHYFK